VATSDQLLETLQADVTALLMAVPGLATATVLPDNEGDIEARVVRALGTLTTTGGKLGLCVVVLLPELEDAEKNLPGPVFGVKVEVQTLENVLFNRGTKGTGIRSSQAALRVLGALHHQVLGTHTLYADKSPVNPVKVKTGHVSHAVTLHLSLSGLQGPGKPLAVVPKMVDGELELACATAGSSIYYTTDGTYPSPAANLYEGPIGGLTEGEFIRTAAYAPDLNPGDVCELLVTRSVGDSNWENLDVVRWEELSETNWENFA